MNDPLYLDAFYWLIMNHDFVRMFSAILTFIALIISGITIIKKWGDSY